MIKIVKDRVIEYREDNLPYILIEGVGTSSITLVEILPVGKQPTQYFIEGIPQVTPDCRGISQPPEVCLIFVTSSNEFVRSNRVTITDWQKFIRISGDRTAIKLAQLEMELREIKTAGINFKQSEIKGRPGEVLMVGSTGKIVAVKLYNKAIQYLNGKTPDNNGVLELKITDFADFMQYDRVRLNVLVELLEGYNKRLEDLEKKLEEIQNTDVL